MTTTQDHPALTWLRAGGEPPAVRLKRVGLALWAVFFFVLLLAGLVLQRSDLPMIGVALPVYAGILFLVTFPARYIARQAVLKGYEYVTWFFYGLVLMPLALVHVLLAKESAAVTQDCPHCRSRVPWDASVCRNCTRELGGAQTSSAAEAPLSTSPGAAPPAG